VAVSIKEKRALLWRVFLFSGAGTYSEQGILPLPTGAHPLFKL
jgi:hypothetical protein